MDKPATVQIYRSDVHQTTFASVGAGDVAVSYESPLWLPIATGNLAHRHIRSPIIDMTKIEGPGARGMERKDATHTLNAAMAEIDRETDVLRITGDVPTNSEWEALGQHFTKVRFLKVATGFGEDWIDAKFPLNWPLELLIIADAISERITTPAILEGRINHLVLLFVCCLRFEGPLFADLIKDATPLEWIGLKVNPEEVTAQSIEEGEAFALYYFPRIWSDWIRDNYGGKEIDFSLDHGNEPPSRMKILDILGNDALQMLGCMAVGKFHLLESLENLTIYSSDADLTLVPAPNFFAKLFGALLKLKHFKITLAGGMYAHILKMNEGAPFLKAMVPPNIETLRLRGPFAVASDLKEFVAAFADPDFLPNLKRISLVFDMPDMSKGTPKEASRNQLRAAHRACKKVLDAAAARGVVVEQFEEPWVENYPRLFRKVDDRWPGQNSTVSNNQDG